MAEKENRGRMHRRYNKVKSAIKRNNYKRKLLNILLIYDKIDCYANINNFDWSDFIKNGLIDNHSSLQQNLIPEYDAPDYWRTSVVLDDNFDSELYSICCDITKNILQKNRERVINFFFRTHSFYDNSWFTLRHRDKAKQAYKDNYEDLLNRINISPENINLNLPYNIYIELEKSFLLEFGTYLEFNFISISDNLYRSKSTESSICISHTFDNPSNGRYKELNLIEEYEYLVTTKITDEIKYFPYPENMYDVLKYRERKEIRLFREVLSEWLRELRLGNVRGEERIRKDIKKANKELKRLNKWKEYERSPINFVINSIGGHIPILSNILTGIYSISFIYERHIDKKYAWLNMLK